MVTTHTETLEGKDRIAESPSAEESEHVTPWPYLQKYVTLVETSEKKYVFRCLLCNPKKKFLSTSTTSNTNIQTYVQVNFTSTVFPFCSNE